MAAIRKRAACIFCGGTVTFFWNEEHQNYVSDHDGHRVVIVMVEMRSEEKAKPRTKR